MSKIAKKHHTFLNCAPLFKRLINRQKKMKTLVTIKSWFSHGWTKQDNNNILLAIFGIILSVKSCNISKVALQLQESDTSQIAQLNRLNNVLINQGKQLAVQNSELERLVGIMSEMQNQNELTQVSNEQLANLMEQAALQNTTSQRLFKTGNLQSQIVRQQLDLSKSQEDKFKLNDSLENVANTQAVFNTFNKLVDLDLFRSAASIDRFSFKNQLLIVRSVKDALEEQISNKYFLRDTSIRLVWFGFYQYTAVYEERLSVKASKDSLTQKEIFEYNNKAKEFSSFYITFTNAMRKLRIEFMDQMLNSLPRVVRFKK